MNVFKVVILMGTFALALAFAGNDLVNFIGVPLAGYSSYMDLMAQNGTTTTDTFLMTSLQESAHTPWYFLIGSGVIMVFSLEDAVQDLRRRHCSRAVAKMSSIAVTADAGTASVGGKGRDRRLTGGAV